MKPPTIAQRTYWTAVKAVHAARIDPHPGKRCEALAACRMHATHAGKEAHRYLPLLTRLEARHGLYKRVDAYRMTLWPDRRTVEEYERETQAGDDQ